MKLQTINPFTEKEIKSYAPISYSDATTSVEQVNTAWKEWKRTSFDDREKVLQKAAKLLREDQNKYAEQMTQEMGKPIQQALLEIEKCAWVCEFYAKNANQFLAPEPIQTHMKKSYVCFEPLGVILTIMPWNFPFWQVFRFAAPALMAGNAVVLKHAPNVLGCANLIEDVFKQSGLLENTFKHLILDVETTHKVMAHQSISAVTFTGSTKAGRSVASRAGQLLKKSVLELGGSDPYVVLEDADIERAAEVCVKSRMNNNGQSCIAAKRWIVHQKVRKAFQACVDDKLSKFEMTDPMDPKSKLGPIARNDLRDGLHDQVQATVKQGAKVIRGAFMPKEKGFWYPATLLSELTAQMAAFKEELFGPVAVLVEAANEQQAIALANQTSFGLGSAIFTSDIEKAETLARYQLEAGSCFINEMVQSNPHLPFGGIKQSGYGRELGSFGIREFVNVKTVAVG